MRTQPVSCRKTRSSTMHQWHSSWLLTMNGIVIMTLVSAMRMSALSPGVRRIVRIRHQTAFLEQPCPGLQCCSAAVGGRPWFAPSPAPAPSSAHSAQARSQLLPNPVTKCKGRAQGPASTSHQTLTPVRQFSPDLKGRQKSKVQGKSWNIVEWNSQQIIKQFKLC